MLPIFHWSLYLNTWGIWQCRHIVPSSEPSSISASSAQARWRRQRAPWRWCWCSRARACTPPRTFQFFLLRHCSGPGPCLGFERKSICSNKIQRGTKPEVGQLCQCFYLYFRPFVCWSLASCGSCAQGRGAPWQKNKMSGKYKMSVFPGPPMLSTNMKKSLRAISSCCSMKFYLWLAPWPFFHFATGVGAKIENHPL